MADQKKTTELDDRDLDTIRGGAGFQFNPETVSRSLSAGETSSESEEVYHKITLTNATISQIRYSTS